MLIYVIEILSAIDQSMKSCNSDIHTATTVYADALCNVG